MPRRAQRYQVVVRPNCHAGHLAPGMPAWQSVGRADVANNAVELGKLRRRAGNAKRAIDSAAVTDAARSEPADPFIRTQIHVAAGMAAV